MSNFEMQQAVDDVETLAIPGSEEVEQPSSEGIISKREEEVRNLIARITDMLGKKPFEQADASKDKLASRDVVTGLSLDLGFLLNNPATYDAVDPAVLQAFQEQHAALRKEIALAPRKPASREPSESIRLAS